MDIKIRGYIHLHTLDLSTQMLINRTHRHGQAMHHDIVLCMATLKWCPIMSLVTEHARKGLLG